MTTTIDRAEIHRRNPAVRTAPPSRAGRVGHGPRRSGFLLRQRRSARTRYTPEAPAREFPGAIADSLAGASGSDGTSFLARSST
jgi:hypothetical protein